MTVAEIISSGLLESYVVGTASDEESALINELSKKHPELLQEIEAIEKSLLEFSSRSNTKLNPELKDKITAKLFDSEKTIETPPARVIPLSSNRLFLYKFAAAASLLLFVTSFFYAVLLQKRLNEVNNEMAALAAEKTYTADALKVSQASLAALSSEMQIVSDPNNKKITLKGMNSLYATSASIHWNLKTNEVYFNASGLPLPDNKQYQLWAIVNGKPVDAGLIELNGDVVFQRMNNISNAQAFAVTIENKGGSAVPSLETMCLLGNV